MEDKPTVVFCSREGHISTINTEFSRALSEILQGEVKAMTTAAFAVEADAKERCPVDTDILRESITSTVEVEADKSVHGYVGSNLEYAPNVHEGTGLYAKDGNGRKDVPWWFPADTLSAKAREKLLIIKTKDGREFARTKGIKPVPFLQDAIDAKRDEIVNYFKGVLGGRD